MLSTKKHLTLFGGPSLELIPSAWFKDTTILPPIKRGDLEDLMQNHQPGLCLIVDGLFGGNMAVTPTECRQLMEKGWTVFGCSSMGALRAADLWSLGMIGLGSIYNQYRLGRLKSDADVAVVYEKTEAGRYQELTVSIVHLLFLLKHIQKQNEIDQIQLNQMMLKAKKIFWVDRTWDLLLEAWQGIGVDQQILTRCTQLKNQPEFHPKKQDAFEAVHLIQKFS